MTVMDSFFYYGLLQSITVFCLIVSAVMNNIGKSLHQGNLEQTILR
ncbi:hypothetical protein tinsulaeT_07030 [Thalassotalea insulae]|uniref:Uncharacterized protein n=1 Tax=Thalassotalea insulae TaxID=2056778 RepID=A0ABQ6GMZ2_9GAMM|nr:hypothetical protein tinsulaeT_07030 [Thalassotalea insulae]